MSSHPQAISLLIVSLLIAFSPFTEACGISVYWGQDGREQDLRVACSERTSSGDTLYKYVPIAFLTTFGNNQVPVLNLAGHCDPPSGTCRRFSSDIEYCQSQGIKVLLSLGGDSWTYTLTSTEDANQVAQYLYTNYLGGGSDGPLGNVVLDGIDFDIERGTNQYWDDLARALSRYTTPRGKVYLSAAPQCPLNFNLVLEGAIKTGLFDYIWVQFYNNPGCDIRSGVSGLLAAWNDWNAYLDQYSPNSQLFMGLPASEAAGNGYIDPDQLKTAVLPEIKKSEKYGGLMVWNRYQDILNNFSPRVAGDVCSSGEELFISQVV